MPKFRKKPIVIEAMQFDGSWDNFKEIIEWGKDKIIKAPYPMCDYPGLLIQLHDGYIRVHTGDWIIKGIMGEFYPYKQDIFEATYERVE